MATKALTAEQRARVRTLIRAGATNAELARVFSVSRPNIAYHRAMLERGTRRGINAPPRPKPEPCPTCGHVARRASRSQLEAAAAIKPSGKDDDDRAI